jgi:hypothetical protein
MTPSFFGSYQGLSGSEVIVVYIFLFWGSGPLGEACVQVLEVDWLILYQWLEKGFELGVCNEELHQLIVHLQEAI